jgi:hypothetical protein
MSYELIRPPARRPIPGIATRAAQRRQQPATYRGGLGGFWTDLFTPSLSAPDDVVNAWAAQVKARGNFATRMPSGAQVGKLGERHTIDAAGHYTIQLAPQAVLDADAKLVAEGQVTIATDQFFTALQPDALLKDAGKALGAGVSAVTGIPTWAIPVLIIGGGAFVLMSAAHSFLPDRRSK